MSPLEIKIMLHYHTTPSVYEYPNDSPLYPATIASFVKEGLLEKRAEFECHNDELRITEKGIFYVTALCSIPLPVGTWEIPDQCKK